MNAGENDPVIRSLPCPDCRLCGTRGELRYAGIKDRLFGTPGTWNLKECPGPGCGLLWLDPMPIEDDIVRAYRTYFTHGENVQDSDRHSPGLFRRGKRFYREGRKEGYLANRYGYRSETVAPWKTWLGMLMYLCPARRADLDARVMYLRRMVRGRLLEVGCGGGRMLKFMQDLGWQVEGVDFDPVAVANAESKGLDVRLGNLEEQGYPDDHFDAVTMHHLIEHVSDPVRLLRECRRILKPLGRLVAVTPNVESLGHRVYRQSWRGLEPPRHLHIFNRKSLGRLAEKAGFRTFDIFSTSRGAKDLFAASRSIQRAGSHVPGGPVPFPVLWARGMQFLEWALVRFSPGAGEEIVLITRK